ncbi:MAG TPA: HK97 family phage prohead protease [Desulfitobacteriaceae bacterium]|nr:HK97 family phage prohead protease [Desulfitobacteriaceae bacterium]
MPKKKLPAKGTAEIRSFNMLDLQVDPEGNVIQGHAAVFGQAANIYGWFNEVIERGAFDRTDFTDVLFSINHDLEKIPLARSRNNNLNSTLQLQVDDQGLNTRAVLDIENNAEAKALYGAVSRGDISGMSFIFNVRDEKWENLDSDMPTRYITDIAKVFEVSAVSFPAYAGTDIVARKQPVLDSAAKALESARSKLESLADEQQNKELEESRVQLELEKTKLEKLY